MQADSHDGVDLGYGEPVRQAIVQRLLLDAQDGVERAGQQVVDFLAPSLRSARRLVRTVHDPRLLVRRFTSAASYRM